MNLDELVLYVDDSLLAVNKPAGLAVLPDGYNPQAPYLRGVLEPAFGRLWNVHRLDRATSGLVLLARSAQAHRSLNRQFEQRQVFKVYHALVAGDPPWEERTVKLPLRADGDRRHRTVVDHRRGKPAVTNLRVLERYGAYTLVEAIPETGRTHQIRVHLADQAAPIVADGLYGSGEGIYASQIEPGVHTELPVTEPLLDRLGLHAWSLVLQHPQSQSALTLTAPYPADFASVLNYLRKGRRSIQ